MITWIGLCAGEIWHYLDRHPGEASSQSLFAAIDAPKETILMAVGWLAREGYVLINGSLPDFTVQLNSKLRR
ncbi:MAG: winged helix-turn-helix domain-containing protein [Candidatus Omnitrophica bacterium]|nr:winged helix-turn-helix domain-containing protein [Candidatus Omnitrophota bacterium]